MKEREPMTQTMNTADASRAFAKLVEKVSKRQARVAVEENGKTIAALVSADDLERLKRLDAREEAWRVVDEIRARNRDKDPDEVERDIAEAIEEMRAEDRARLKRAKQA